MNKLVVPTSAAESKGTANDQHILKCNAGTKCGDHFFNIVDHFKF